MKKYWNILIGLSLVSLIASCSSETGYSSGNESSSTDYYQTEETPTTFNQPITPSQPTFNTPVTPSQSATDTREYINSAKRDAERSITESLDAKYDDLIENACERADKKYNSTTKECF